MNGYFVIPDKAHHILRNFPEIKQFQVIQEHNKNLLIKIVQDVPLIAKHKDSIIKQFKDYLGNVEIYIQIVDQIPLEKGKNHYIKLLIGRAC